MDLSDWRARIDAVDRILLELINRRMGYAQEIGRIKQALGQQVRDPEREREIIRALQRHNQGPLDGEAVATIFGCIIGEARRLEERD
ncbi:MAG: chorismate mutase [Gemmatimonadota bacterium]